MASTPVSSIASSATNVADVLASLGDDALAAEVGSWSAELQSKVVAAVSALSTSTPTSASTAVRRRKSNKLDAASSSTAASWLAPAVAPADLTAELAAIQEGRRSPAATTIADDEVINFGAMQTPLGNPPAVVVDFSGAIGPDLGGPGGSGADSGGHGGAAGGHSGAGGTTPTATTSSATTFLATGGGDARHRRLLPRRLRPSPRRPGSLRLTAVMRARHRRLLHPPQRSNAGCTAAAPIGAAEAQGAAPPIQGGQHRRFIGFVALLAGGGHHAPAAELQLPGPEPHEQVDDYAERSATVVAQRSSLSELQRQIAGDVHSGGDRQLGDLRRWCGPRRLPLAGGQGQAGAPTASTPSCSLVRRLATGSASSSSTPPSAPTSTALQIPQVVREENSDDDLPEGFDI